MPQVALKGIATGLCLMAVFTLIWSGIAFGGLHTGSYWPLLLIFPLFSILFIVNAVRLFSIVKYFPALVSPEDIAREKSTGKWFGIIFGAEGLGIFIAINVVVNLGHPELTIPAIALVVGLHFFPLAKVFRRTVDYYLATYSTLIAITAIILSYQKTFNQNETLAFTGIGLALATSIYGFYMLVRGWKARGELQGTI